MELTKPTRFGIFEPPHHMINNDPSLLIRRQIEKAELLDHLGYDEVWWGEHHSGGFEMIGAPDLLIAAAAENTKHLNFGTGVYSLPYHNPLIAADRITFLHNQTRGRLIFGNGPGKLPQDAYMMGIKSEELRKRQNEALEAIIPLLHGEAVTMKTEWFDLHDARTQLSPHKNETIELAAASTISPSGPTLAGKHGMSMISLGGGDETMLETLPANWGTYEKEAAAHGNTVDRSKWRIAIGFYLADTVEEAERACQRNILEFCQYMKDLTGLDLPFGNDPVGAVKHWKTEGLGAFGLPVIGTPDMAIERIEEFVERSGGFGTVLILKNDAVDWPFMKRSFELFAEEVIPHFQETNLRRAASHQYLADNSERLISDLSRGLNKAAQDYYGDDRTIPIR